MGSLINKIQQSRFLYAGLALYLVIFIYGFLFLHQAESVNRVLKEVWNLGHILAFAGLMILVIKISKTYSNLPLSVQFILAGILAGLLGLSIEVVQRYTGRTFSLNDVLLNVIGALTAVALYSPKLRTADGRIVIVVRLVMILCILVVSKNAIIFSFDSYQAHRQFPVLLDLSNPFELTRWRGNSVKYKVANFEQTSGLQAEFRPAKYSTLILDHFPRDWSGYKNIKFVAYNAENDKIKIEIRIHDLTHVKSGAYYSDRFNGRLNLKPGWNTMIISLHDIKQAPRKREMDMRQIHQLMLYFPNLSVPKKLLIRDIRLTD